ncbi:LuxR C-terminal-related transcriptional regulator [Intrasporangium mesophilum]
MDRSTPSSSLVQRGRFDSPFFRSKFRVPSTPDHFVTRPRLTELLDELADLPVTALVAPAGAGKTALAADWVRRGARRAAWLALDDADGEPAQFWASMMAALDALAAGVADRALPLVRRTGGLEDALRVLGEDLELADPPPAVLVIDDLHHLGEDAVSRATLVSFVEHRPPWLHLMLLSRHHLALPVDRLRARGELADIAFDVLRFSDTEATEMLTGLCPSVPREVLVEVADRSGGWAAALQLAALAIRVNRVPHGTDASDRSAPAPGSDRLIDHYVWHEVLEGEHEDMIDLLLRISVVDRVNFGLAEALSGRSDAGDLLMEAESRGLFVTSLDAGGWFEVHSLVREMLLAELGRRWPERLLEQHARAAHWFESVGDEPAALEQWLEAGEPRQALRLLSDIAVSLVDAGRRSVIRRVVADIPAEVSSADLDSMVRFAWCQLMVDRRGFLDALARAELAASVRTPGTADAVNSAGAGAIEVLQSAAALVNGDWRAGEDAARDALAAFGTGAPGHPLGRFAWGLVAHGIALDERWDDDGPEVGEVRVQVGADPERRLAHEGARAVGLVLAGHPLDSLRVAAGIRHVTQAGDRASLRTELDLAGAIAARELGDRERAESALHALADQPAYPSTFVQVLALLELVAARVADDDLAAADALFQRCRELCQEQFAGAGAMTWLAGAGAALALAGDDVDAAEHWAEGVGDPFWGPLWAARIDTARGRYAAATDALETAVPRCARHRVVRGLVLARATVDDRERALKAVEAAIELAAEHGMLRTVASEAGGLVDLVELSAWRVPDGWMDRFRRAVVLGHEEAATPLPRLVEGLTDRERDVLRLLPSRLTLREIASELFVSQNTLKFHLRVIYRKLGVNSRAEAVEQARRFRLLSGGGGSSGPAGSAGPQGGTSATMRAYGRHLR